MRNLLLVISLALGSLGCEPVHTPGISESNFDGREPNGSNQENGEEESGNRDPVLNFAFVAERVIGASMANPGRCLRCHQSGGSAEFYPMTKYSEVKSLAADIISTSVSGQSMPPASAPQLLPCQKQLLLAWVEAGTPEFGDVSVPEGLQECR